MTVPTTSTIPAFQLELPPGWWTIRTASTAAAADVEALLTEAGSARWSRELAEGAAGVLVELARAARGTGTALMALTLGEDRRTGLQLGSITAGLADTSPALASMEMCRQAVGGRPDAQEIETPAGAALLTTAVEPAGRGLAEFTGDGQTSRCTAYLPASGTPYVLVCSVQLTGRRRLALARLAAVRLVGSFHLLPDGPGPRWIGAGAHA